MINLEMNETEINIAAGALLREARKGSIDGLPMFAKCLAESALKLYAAGRSVGPDIAKSIIECHEIAGRCR